MQNRGTWTAFLVMCFLVVGLTGLFASYGTVIPLERALRRGVTLDQVLLAARQNDTGRLAQLRPELAESAELVLSGPGDIADRVAAARREALSIAAREEASVAYRIRLMLGVVTVLAAGLGAGILAMAGRPGRG